MINIRIVFFVGSIACLSFSWSPISAMHGRRRIALFPGDGHTFFPRGVTLPLALTRIATPTPLRPAPLKRINASDNLLAEKEKFEGDDEETPGCSLGAGAPAPKKKIRSNLPSEDHTTTTETPETPGLPPKPVEPIPARQPDRRAAMHTFSCEELADRLRERGYYVQLIRETTSLKPLTEGSTKNIIILPFIEDFSTFDLSEGNVLLSYFQNASTNIKNGFQKESCRIIVANDSSLELRACDRLIIDEFITNLSAHSGMGLYLPAQNEKHLEALFKELDCF
jgi:hypothetical protein